MASVPQQPESAVSPILTKPDLVLVRPPKQVLTEAHEAAKALVRVLEKNPNKVMLNGKRYLTYEDWQTAGRFFGVTAIVRSTKYVQYGDDDYQVRGFEAAADALLVGPNQVISSAEAMCLNDEPNWNRKPLFQIRSMAQTRACAKAFRNCLAWIVVIAGFSPTPAEEMDEQNGQGNYGISSPKRKSQGQSSDMEVLNNFDNLSNVKRA